MRGKNFFRKILGLFAVVMMTPSASVFAITAADLDIFAQNDILFYNPSNGCTNSTSEYARGSSSYGNLSALQVGFIDTYHDLAVRLSINYGIPWEAVMAQGIWESAAGTSFYAVDRNNFFGIGAFDSNPDNAFHYDTPEAGWEGYYKNIQITPTYREHGVFAGETVTDPYKYLEAIKAAGYATDSNYVNGVSTIIAAVEDYAKHKGWPSSLELANTYPEWYENAEKNRQGAGGEGSVSAPVKVCNNKGGSVSLSSGGMTLEEAERFMEAYATESNEFARGDLFFDGAFVSDSGCPSGTLNNCSAFTQWFLNRYTTLGGPNGDGVQIKQGSLAVGTYLSEFPDLIDGGKTPRAYAIVSMGPEHGSREGWPNHTGIVLGVDKDNNILIIGEASCGSNKGERYYAPRAYAYDLSVYTDNPSQFGPTYAYTDNVLKGF